VYLLQQEADPATSIAMNAALEAVRALSAHGSYQVKIAMQPNALQALVALVVNGDSPAVKWQQQMPSTV
jgi:hypothetical protein